MNKVYKKMFADLFFPARCPVCGDAIPVERRAPVYRGKETESCYLCEDCEGLLQVVTGPVCSVCGAPTEAGSSLCHGCSRIPRSFSGGRALFVYNGPARAMMMDLKYHGRKETAEYLGCAIAARLGDWIRSVRPDCMVPVPLHPEKMRTRGYNQAEVIARAVEERTGVPVKELLLRGRNTEAAKNLGQKSRAENLAGAFLPAGKIPPGLRILLVDDIYTTGATMEECAEVLLREGQAEAVYVLSACTGR